MEGKEVQKNWFYLNDDSQVKEGLGFSRGPKTWWVPSAGFTMNEGTHLFETRRAAREAGIKAIQEKINILQGKLAKLQAE